MSNPMVTVIVAAANEGIPVAAIARITKQDLSDVYLLLKEAKDVGHILDLPRADWPPGVRASERLPTLSIPADDDLKFVCKRTLKLTALETGFLISLLKNREVDKTRLHHVVEQQRSSRQSQPDKQDETDPKMVDVIICKLRKKLKTVDAALKIETIWGGGYCIDADMKPRILAAAYGETNGKKEAGSQRQPAPAA